MSALLTTATEVPHNEFRPITANRHEPLTASVATPSGTSSTADQERTPLTVARGALATDNERFRSPVRRRPPLPCRGDEGCRHWRPYNCGQE